MAVLVIDADQGRRLRIGEAIEWSGLAISLIEATSVEEGLERASGGRSGVSLVLVGPGKPGNATDALHRLRTLTHPLVLVAYDRFLTGKPEMQRELMQAGADMVFDERMSTFKMALILKRLILQNDGDALSSVNPRLDPQKRPPVLLGTS